MKTLTTILLLISSSLLAQNTKEYLKELKEYRLEMDKEFGDTAQITSRESKNGKYISYYTELRYT